MFSFNRQMPIISRPVSGARLWITAFPTPPGGGYCGPPWSLDEADNLQYTRYAPLTINDAVDLDSANAENVIWTTPRFELSSLMGRTIVLPEIANGLVISACPPGVAGWLAWQ